MIKQLRSGAYKLIETKDNTKVLYLDNDIYAWVEPKNIGEILVYSHKVHRADCALAMGHYILYEVRDEPRLSDGYHLELEFGHNAWQGYLLLTSLPDNHHQRGRIIPTIEVITNNTRFITRNLKRNLAKSKTLLSPERSRIS